LYRPFAGSEQRSVTSSQGKRIEAERNIGETIYIRENN